MFHRHDTLVVIYDIQTQSGTTHMLNPETPQMLNIYYFLEKYVVQHNYLLYFCAAICSNR